jgi:hypothetical protein
VSESVLLGTSAVFARGLVFSLRLVTISRDHSGSDLQSSFICANLPIINVDDSLAIRSFSHRGERVLVAAPAPNFISSTGHLDDRCFEGDAKGIQIVNEANSGTESDNVRSMNDWAEPDESIAPCNYLFSTYWSCSVQCRQALVDSGHIPSSQRAYTVPNRTTLKPAARVSV